MFKKIKDFILKILAKPAIDEAGDLLENQLRKMHEKNPKLFRLLIVSTYVAAKEYGDDLVASTATDLDDTALKEYYEAVEKVAAEFGIDLPKEAEALKEN